MVQIMWSLWDISCTYENVLDACGITSKTGEVLKHSRSIDAYIQQGDSFQCRNYFFLFDNTHIVLGCAERENSWFLPGGA